MLGLTHLFKAASGRRHVATASGLLSLAMAILAPAHAQTSVQNTATIALPPDATVVDSNPANNTSTATVSVLALPRLTLVKQVVNDNGGTAAASAWTLVATGASTTISGATGTATVTSAAVPAGTYALSETGGVAGYAAGTWSCVKNGGAPVSANSVSLVGGDVATCTITNDDQAATLTLVKTVINDNGGTATVSSFPLTATGPTTITGVSGTAAVTNASVNAGVYTLSEVTAAGYAAGSWSCSAGTLSGDQLTLANGQSATCTIVNTFQPAPALTLDKTASPTTVSASGQTVTYSFLVTNTGNVTITGLQINETVFSGTGAAPVITCPVTTLAPTESTTCAGTYTVTQQDIDAGSITNTATASGTNPAGGTTTSPTDSATVTATAAPAQTLLKALTSNADGDASGTVSVGDVLTYTVTMTNTGNTTLTGVVVNDSKITPNTIACASVAPGAACVLMGNYTVTATDVTVGNVSNTAVVTSPVCPVGSTAAACTTTVVTPVVAPVVEYFKASDKGPMSVSVGDTITYSLTAVVSNSQLAAALVLTDTLSTGLTFGAVNSQTPAGSYTVDSSGAPVITFTLPAGTLPGTYTVTYTTTVNGDAVDAVTNQVVGNQGGCQFDNVCETSTPVTAPAVSYSKSASTTGPVAVGDTITYTLTTVVANSQTTSVTTLTDTLGTGLTFGAVTNAGAYTCNSTNPLVCTLPVGTLPGTYTVTYTATVNDQAVGTVDNAVVGTNATCTTNCGTSTPVTAPAVSYSKSVELPVGQTEVSAGDTLTYTLTATIGNSSTTALLTLTDTLGTGLTLGAVSAGNFSCGTANPLVCTLPSGTAPGTYSLTYTAIVNDQATGTVRNAVVGTGEDAPTCAGTCTTETPVTEPLPPLVTYAKSAVLPAGQTEVRVGDTVTYTLTTTVVNAVTTGDLVLTDTLGAGLTFGTVTNGGSYAANTSGASVLTFTLPAGTVPGTYTVTYTATVNPQARGTVNNAVVGAGDDAPTCSGDCTTETPVAAPRVVVSKSSDPGNGAQVQVGQTVRYTLAVDVAGSALTQELVLVDTPDRGLTLGALPAGCAFDGTLLTCRLPAGTSTGVHPLTYDAIVNENAGAVVGNQVTASGGGGETPICTTCSTEHELDAPEIRLTKTAGSREVRIGDLVRYTLTVQNVGSVALINGSVVDTPAAGFSYVEGSLLANDADGMATVAGGNPLRFDGVDVAAGQSATLVYVMRVGAGVRPGTHVNQAQVRSATDDPISNIATAEVQLTADPLLDDSLVFGTVFNDRDSDGWQDSAALSGVKVQGGFAPAAYIANSTTVDRGAGPQPEPDASSPLLHGIAVGEISGRQSVADPVEDHEVVIRQRLREAAFTDDFVLTTAQGVTVRMDEAGMTRLETSGDAAKGLTAAAPTVERRVAQSEGGYVVDYVIRNAGIDERGIPGVRIASVEGLLIETDQFGRYHLAGVPGGAWERGRNFILKVDPSTLPAGAEFTTDNPLLRRITPGVPVRFDWGVKLPEQVIEGGTKQVELEMGEVFFAPGSAEVREKYLPVVEAMAAKVREYQGGEVVIHANGDNEGLAFDRANAVKAALLATLDTASAKGLVVSVRGTVDDPSSMIVGVDEGGALLGTVLFDTDKSAIKPVFEPLLDKVAAALEKMGGGSIAIVGHTDVRASHAYNVALGMRRAKAVYEALAKRLSPEVRAKVRVEASNDPTAPVGVRK